MYVGTKKYFEEMLRKENQFPYKYIYSILHTVINSFPGGIFVILYRFLENSLQRWHIMWYV